MYFSEGGQASVEDGRCFGTETPILKKSWSSMASRVGLYTGSNCNMFEINDLLCLDSLIWSGNVY
jgi:hypothetical protein